MFVDLMASDKIIKSDVSLKYEIKELKCFHKIIKTSRVP